jgi:putative redox protein
MLKINTSYKSNGYTLETDRAIVKIGSKEGELFPYDMLLGALSSCFYYTLLEILEKRKSDIPDIEIIVTGDKREKVPTTLEWVNLDITVYGNVDEAQFLRFVDLAAKYCSIHETISKVATMTHNVHFIAVE